MSSIGGDDTLAPEVRELLDQRSLLQKWLMGLEAQRGITSERILERVREDYESRLASTNESLSGHVDGIRAEMERAIERSDEAERLHDAAVDELEEGRLRRAIGELPADGWEDRERQLMDEVRSAKITEDGARTEVDRLHELLGTLTGDIDPVAPESDAAVVPDVMPAEPIVAPVPVPSSPPRTPVVSERWDLDATVESGNGSGIQPVDLPPPAPVAEEEGAQPLPAEVRISDEDDGQAEQEEASGLLHADDIPSPDKVPPPGLKCIECGYTNDLSAWTCEVCGADVG